MKRLLAALLGLLTISATAPGETWRVASSTHFVIYAQMSDQALRAYAGNLERFDSALRLLFPPEGSEETDADRVTIYVLPSEYAVQKIMGYGPSNTAGVYRSTLAGAIALVPASSGGDLSRQAILLHEYAHHYMRAQFPAVYPLWVVEGFAEFVSYARFERNGVLSIGMPARSRAFTLGGPNELPLERMLADRTSGLDDQLLLSLYGYSWLLTHYLYFDKARDGQIERYLREINDGKSPERAAVDSFGELKRLEQELSRYVLRQSLPIVTLPASLLHPGEITIATVSPGEAAIIPIRADSQFGVTPDEAAKLVIRARAAAAPFANDPAVQCALAEAETDADNLDAADAAADRALALDGKRYCALLYKGRVALERAHDAKAGPQDPRWARARSWLIRANGADVENPYPMYLYYQSFVTAGTPPTPSAIKALLGAAERAPQQPGVRIAATIQLLHERKEKEAKAMIAPVANQPHGGAHDFFQGIYARIGNAPPDVIARELEQGPPKTSTLPGAPASQSRAPRKTTAGNAPLRLPAALSR